MAEEEMETIEEGIYAMQLTFQMVNEAITVKDTVSIRLNLMEAGTE